MSSLAISKRSSTCTETSMLVVSGGWRAQGYTVGFPNPKLSLSLKHLVTKDASSGTCCHLAYPNNDDVRTFQGSRTLLHAQ